MKSYLKWNLILKMFIRSIFKIWNAMWKGHVFVQNLNKFSKIKYILNLFLWNLLKLSGAKINRPKIYEPV